MLHGKEGASSQPRRGGPCSPFGASRNSLLLLPQRPPRPARLQGSPGVPKRPDFSDGQKSLLQKLLISTPFGPGNIQFHKIRKCWAWNAHRVGIAPRPGRSGLRREPPKMGFTVKMFLSPQLPARNITSTGLCSGDSPESFGLWFASLGSRRLQTRRPISKR